MGITAVLVAALWIGTVADLFEQKEAPGCKWFCANWCNPDILEYCHQKECNAENEKDCPGSYCQLELACREGESGSGSEGSSEGGSEKYGGGDQKVLMLAVPAACLVAICVGALCCYQYMQLSADEDAGSKVQGIGMSRAAQELDGVEQQAAVRIQRATRAHQRSEGGARGASKPRRTSKQVSPRWMATRTPAGALAAPKKPAGANMV